MAKPQPCRGRGRQVGTEGWGCEETVAVGGGRSVHLNGEAASPCWWCVGKLIPGLR